MDSSNYSSITLPSIGKSSNNKSKISPVRAPTGGYFSGLQSVRLTQPSRAFINNNMAAQVRAIGTVPEEAMTPDVHSDYWSMR